LREGVFFSFRFLFQFLFSRRGKEKRRRPHLSLSPLSPSLSLSLRSNLQSHWPFHREDCRHNAFADAIEESEPEFASWLRRHGKQVRKRGGGERKKAIWCFRRALLIYSNSIRKARDIQEMVVVKNDLGELSKRVSSLR